MSKTIGVDLGTHCGVAIVEDGPGEPTRWTSYTVDLSTPKDAHPGERYLRAAVTFAELIETHRPGVVYYEHIFRHVGTQAAHVYGGLLAMLAAECARAEVRLVPVGVGAVKIAATGKGNAKKPEMVAAAMERWGGEKLDENETDARFVLVAAFRGITGAQGKKPRRA